MLQWEPIAYRCGYVALAQIPLVVLLAGKRNIIGFFVGVGYERLSYLHRWVARVLLLTILIHAGFWFREWIMYNFVARKYQTSEMTRQGTVAGGILLWMVLSSVAPIRGLAYEFFVSISSTGFTGLIEVDRPTRSFLVELPIHGLQAHHTQEQYLDMVPAHHLGL